MVIPADITGYYAVAKAYQLSPKESGKLVDHSGITATTAVNLPVATAGLDYSINRASAGAIRVKPHGIDKINGSAGNKQTWTRRGRLCI
jgi:hypothetical protein